MTSLELYTRRAPGFKSIEFIRSPPGWRFECPHGHIDKICYATFKSRYKKRTEGLFTSICTKCNYQKISDPTEEDLKFQGPVNIETPETIHVPKNEKIQKFGMFLFFLEELFSF